MKCDETVNLIKSVVDILQRQYSHTHQICIEYLEMVIKALEHSQWETPEQRKKRTGKAWAGRNPVWFDSDDLYSNNGKINIRLTDSWTLMEFDTAKHVIANCLTFNCRS
jgi:hypothetical protein